MSSRRSEDDKKGFEYTTQDVGKKIREKRDEAKASGKPFDPKSLFKYPKDKKDNKEGDSTPPTPPNTPTSKTGGGS
jgi:hypothetical protein